MTRFLASAHCSGALTALPVPAHNQFSISHKSQQFDSLFYLFILQRTSRSVLRQPRPASPSSRSPLASATSSFLLFSLFFFFRSVLSLCGGAGALRADIIVWRFVMAPGTRVCPTTPTVCTPRSSWSPFPPSSSGPRCTTFAFSFLCCVRACVRALCCVSCVMLMLGLGSFTLGWPWRSSGRGRMSLASQHRRFPRQVKRPSHPKKGRFALHPRACPSISNLFHVLVSQLPSMA